MLPPVLLVTPFFCPERARWWMEERGLAGWAPGMRGIWEVEPLVEPLANQAHHSHCNGELHRWASRLSRTNGGLLIVVCSRATFQTGFWPLAGDSVSDYGRIKDTARGRLHNGQIYCNTLELNSVLFWRQSCIVFYLACPSLSLYVQFHAQPHSVCLEALASSVSTLPFLMKINRVKIEWAPRGRKTS